jgi:threonine dehydratase
MVEVRTSREPFHLRGYRLSLERIAQAIAVIDPVFLNSPQFRAESLESHLGCRVVVKVETLNPIRSFKGRGAEYLTATLDGRPHLVCATAGNFGQGMAYAARKRGRAPAMERSWRSGRPEQLDRADTIADGIAVRAPFAEAVADITGLVDDMLLVEDRQLVTAMRLAHSELGVVLEPSGAAGLAALLGYRDRFRAKLVATIFTGGNITAEQMREWLF